ncbi:MAG TPA: hypothetical protein VMV48_14105 [Gallionellaceae bacterium]|nr:hypothetical protein [Gallionellaceae bacterium]
MKIGIRLTAILFSVFIATAVCAADKPQVPQLDVGKGGQCVEDPKLMRKIHMNLLKHQRDETMHKGIRGQKYSLADCVECHASNKTNSVLGSNEAFCQGCHTYAAVKLDCFECHTSKRKVTAEASK